MVRTPWSILASAGFHALIQRLARGCRPTAAPRPKLRRRSDMPPSSWQAEVLQERILLTGPTANNDSYSVSHDHTLSPSTGVLANDTTGGSGSGSGSGGGSLTATLVSGVGHGSLTLNSSGTFTYNPTTGYTG